MSGFMNKRLAKKKFLTDIIERFDKSNPSSSYFCEEIVVKSDTNVPTSVIRKTLKWAIGEKSRPKYFTCIPVVFIYC